MTNQPPIVDQSAKPVKTCNILICTKNPYVSKDIFFLWNLEITSVFIISDYTTNYSDLNTYNY